MKAHPGVYKIKYLGSITGTINSTTTTTTTITTTTTTTTNQY